MITNNFNKELRGISDALRDLGYTDSTIGLRQRYWKEYCFFHGSLDIDEASMDEFLLKNYDIQSGNIKQKILSKDIWVRTAETQPFFAFLSIIQNFSLGFVVRSLYSSVVLGNSSLKGRITFWKNRRPLPGSALVT